MDYLVIGLGITGISTVKTLSKMGLNVYAYDSNISSKEDEPEELKDIKYTLIFDLEEAISKDIICVKSPGIPPHNELIQKISNRGIEIVSDLEMAYRLFGDRNLISITGTNGKTTTTMLVNHILNESGKSSIAIGNIGVGMLWEIYSNPEIDYFVIESSSFQLDSTTTFRTKVAAFTNISPDHSDWHGSFDVYFKAKQNIFKNQKPDDKLILNIDDKRLRKLKNEIKSEIISTSLEDKNALFYYDKPFIYRGGKRIIDARKLRIPGLHNVQNVLVAAAITNALNISDEDIERACYSFNAVEHRIEFVRELNKVKFYNDSKGTNMDSTIKALSSFENPIILIAGGYDKKVSFKEMFEQYGDRIKKLILMGETATQMREEAKGVRDINIVKDMKEAVELSYKVMDKGDVVLLSPACASWGMYKNYMDRGNEFKDLVNNLGD